MADRELSRATSVSSYTALTSIPMWAKFGNAFSVKSTTFERLIIKFKDPQNKNLIDDFLKDMRLKINAYRDQNIQVYNYANSQQTLA
jgi:hypothetical protein